MKELFTCKEIKARFGGEARYPLGFICETYHDGLKEFRTLAAPTRDLLQYKIDMQRKMVEAKWHAHLNPPKKMPSVDEAAARTSAAETLVQEVKSILRGAPAADGADAWQTLKDAREFGEPQPHKPALKQHEHYPEKPADGGVELTLMERIFKSAREKKIAAHKARYEATLENWGDNKRAIEEKNAKVDADNEKHRHEWEESVKKWEERRDAFLAAQSAFNGEIDRVKDAYMRSAPDAVCEYCDMILNISRYPDGFPKSYELEYDSDAKMLVADYQLPSITDMPRIKLAEYFSVKKQIVEKPIPDEEISAMLDGAMYQTALRVVRELFAADTINALDSVAFNGLAMVVNRATGAKVNECILSLHVKKADFAAADLENGDAKEIFASLNGVATSDVRTLAPVKPIQQLKKIFDAAPAAAPAAAQG